MKGITTIFILLACIFQVFSQEFVNDYDGGRHDQAFAITRGHGDYYISGGLYTTGSRGILKMDLSGELLWVLELQNSRSTPQVIDDIVRTKDGNYLYAANEPQEETINGDWLPFISKFDSNGNVLWEKTLEFGFISEERRYCYPINLLPLDNGDFIVHAISIDGSEQTIGDQELLLKIDQHGEVLWELIIQPKYEDILDQDVVILEEQVHLMLESRIPDNSLESVEYFRINMKGEITFKKEINVFDNLDRYSNLKTANNGDLLVFESSLKGDDSILKAYRFDQMGNLISKSSGIPFNEFYLSLVYEELLNGDFLVYGLHDFGKATILQIDRDGNLVRKEAIDCLELERYYAFDGFFENEYFVGAGYIDRGDDFRSNEDYLVFKKKYFTNSSTETLNLLNNEIALKNNPTSDKIILEFPEKNNWKLRVLNVNGTLILEKNIESMDVYQLSKNDLYTGIFFLHIQNDEGFEFVEKIIFY